MARLRERNGNAGSREIQRGALVDAVREEALHLVEQEGPEQLNLRRLRERLGGGFSKTAPLHHFGTVTGLYAAVARQGFDQLTDRLRAERLNRPPTRGLVKQMALSYGVFGLERPHLYRVMHWPAVWARWGDVVTGSEPGQGGPVPADASWILEAGEARERAFAEFVIAVQLGQATGALRSRWSPHDGARVLTSLVDGYLYQTQVERVDASFEILRDYLDRYVKMAIDGLGQPRKKKQS